MTKAPEKLTLYPYTYCNIMDDDDTEFNGWTTPNPDDDLDGWECATQYIRADLYNELERTADDVVHEIMGDPIHVGKLSAAIDAYQQTKEETKQ